MHRQASGANWDDLRFVLAVADRGSVSAAARALGVNHATVLRRVAAFEAAEGMTVFDRTPQGYVVPPDKTRVIDAAREAEAAFAAVSRMIRGSARTPTGPVRLTSTDTFCLTVLPGIAAGLRAALPGLQIDLLCNNAHLDLARMDADLTVRPAPRLPDDLEGEQVGVLGMGVYAAITPGTAMSPAKGQVAGQGQVGGQGQNQGQGLGWLALRGVLLRTPPAAWLAREVAPDQITGGADSFVILRELAAAGLGRTFLPCILGDGDARLQRLPGAAPAFSTPIWVASHADLSQSPHLGQIRAGLAQALRASAPALAGVAIGKTLSATG